MTIKAITGLNGAGKSAMAVSILRRAQAKGFRTAANVRVDGAEHIIDYDQMMDLRHAVLLLDDVTAIASSRNYAAMTPEAVLFFQTLRHHDISLLWTAPTFDRADVVLREVTREWCDVRVLWATRREGSMWKSTRLALTVTGTPKEDKLSPGGYKIDFPWLGLFQPAGVHQHYDSFAELDLFTPERFPSRCRVCGAVLTYPRVTAAGHFHESRQEARQRLLQALEGHEHSAGAVDLVED